MPTDQTFVIVGASLAGAKAAETLRDEGFDGRIVLLGVEAERPSLVLTRSTALCPSKASTPVPSSIRTPWSVWMSR